MPDPDADIQTVRVILPPPPIVTISAFEVISTGGGGNTTVVFSNPGGRLTTESGVPVSTSDRTSQGTLYYTPYLHNNINTWSGTTWQAKTFSEISLTLTVTSGKNYDVFINSSATTLSLSSAWTNNTTRADALGTQDAVTVLSSDHTKLWLGTIRASGSNVTEDSGGGITTQVGGKRFVWNAYNQVKRNISVADLTGSWSYTTGTIRQSNGATGNKVEYVTGDAAAGIDAVINATALLNTSLVRGASSGVGIDSTTTYSGFVANVYNNNSLNIEGCLTGIYFGTPGLGYHFLSWNEFGPDGVCTFLGSNTPQSSGLIATGYF